MPSKRRSTRHLFLPELVEEQPGQWEVHEAGIRDAAVDLPGRRAWVPRALTPAQRLARLHELGHVKYTPRSWAGMVKGAVAWAEANGETIDPSVALRIAKMLEENRIDWLLWDRHGIDLRPAREVLDWSHMPVPQIAVPEEFLSALSWVLQLAWTVWASKGLGAVPNAPPTRATDAVTVAFFDACWAFLTTYHPTIASAIVRGCLEMYRDPTHATRNRVAAELATFFPPQQPEEKQPPEKAEERQAQQEILIEIAAQTQAREREESGGVGNEPVNHGHYEVHDHTAGIRRPSRRLVRREVPQYTGTKLAFPHRYMLDRAVFGRRILTEGGIMIDGSGSMNWTNDDMQALLEQLPAVWIGIYGGGSFGKPDTYGRICILAKRGRFSRFDGLDRGFNGGNDVDLEALQLLATWPKPRFWLSDGYVGGGKQTGPHPDPSLHNVDYLRDEGRLLVAVNREMRRHDILRVGTKEDMHQLVKRQRVTLYRSCVNWQGRPYDRPRFYPDDMVEQPVVFSL